MKLLKLISFLFLVYFIRRFIQAYKAIKYARPASAPTNKENVIDADYKVLD